jgi:hypothetical protein
MLLVLGHRFTVNPAEYAGTLAIRLDTDNRPECGVRSGNHAGFYPEEENQPMPRFNVPSYGLNLGLYDFVIDRPERRARKNQILAYHYVVQGWDNGVYVQHQDIWRLTLSETSDDWSIAIHRPWVNGLDLILPDYEPGWIRQTGASPV